MKITAACVIVLIGFSAHISEARTWLPSDLGSCEDQTISRLNDLPARLIPPPAEMTFSGQFFIPAQGKCSKPFRGGAKRVSCSVCLAKDSQGRDVTTAVPLRLEGRGAIQKIYGEQGSASVDMEFSTQNGTAMNMTCWIGDPTKSTDPDTKELMGTELCLALKAMTGPTSGRGLDFKVLNPLPADSGAPRETSEKAGNAKSLK